MPFSHLKAHVDCAQREVDLIQGAQIKVYSPRNAHFDRRQVIKMPNDSFQYATFTHPLMFSLTAVIKHDLELLIKSALCGRFFQTWIVFESESHMQAVNTLQLNCGKFTALFHTSSYHKSTNQRLRLSPLIAAVNPSRVSPYIRSSIISRIILTDE